MAVYNVHAGHNQLVPGASGYFDEYLENRKVKDRVISRLRDAGHTVYDCTDDVGRTQGQNLSNIVRKCNAHAVNLDISIHFNASNGRGKGVEVLCYDSGTHEVARKICAAVAELGFANRGVKPGAGFYVLNNTRAQAILIECCFCDNAYDASIYNADKMAAAIVKGLTGVSTPANEGKTAERAGESDAVVFTYAAMVEGGRTLPEVRNLADYAGLRGKKITGLKIRCDRGSMWYQVHVLGGGWLPKVTGCDWGDYDNGYAGNGRPIDAVRVYYYTPAELVSRSGYQKAQYRVSPLGKDYYPWQYDNETANGQDGYAGFFGKPIDRFQIF